MTKHIAVCGLLLAGLIASLPSMAGDRVEDTIRNSLSRLIPNTEIGGIKPSPLDGIYEVMVGMRVLYVTGDGNYVLHGNLIDIDTRTDLTEQRLGGVRNRIMAGLDRDSMIIFPASDEKYVITVFTDIDCGYCRKLHSEIANYNSEGITVRYLSFPRTGPNSPSWVKAVSVWCSEDRNTALTRAKAGQDPGRHECDNPVRKHYDTGLEIGVTGTPAIVTESGRLLPGYVPAKRLAAELARQHMGKS